MITRPALLLLAGLCALLPRGAALYFFITDSPRCFIEEVPEDTLIVGSYKNPDFIPWGSPGFSGQGVNVEVRDPTGNVVLARDADSQGRFAFTSAMGGEYVLCIGPNATASSWKPVGGGGAARRFRVDLKLDVGEMGIDYAEVAKREHLTQLEVEIRRLNDKLKDIRKEQAYQREREVSFRDTSEATNSRVKWWSLAQVAVMLASGVWQIFHLKAFFKSKKVV